MLKYLDPSSKRFNIFILIFFILLAALVFGSALNNPFILDDKIQVLNNLHIQSLSNIPSFFYSSSFFESGNDKMVGIYYKPLMTSYYALIWHFFGNNPLAFRIPLLILHILSSFFIFLFSKNFLSKPYAAILACIFLIHPINAEVVLYISDAQDILYFFFGICGLYVINISEKKYSLFFILTILFTLAVLSKETGVLFLLFGIVYTFFIKRKKIMPVSLAAFIVGIMYLLIRMQIGLTQTQIPILLFHTSSFLIKLKMLPLILGHYIELYFFPSRLSLTTDFVFTGFPWDLFWQPLIIVILFLSLTFHISKKIIVTNKNIHLKFFLFVMFCWFILHGQMIVPLDGIYSDRWFYIGTWGLSSIFALWLADQKKIPQSYLFITSILVITAFSIRTYTRSLDWRDPFIFYSREAKLHPWDALMNNNVGIFLFRQGKIIEAENYFKISTESNPKWPIGWNNLGVAQEQQQQLTAALNSYYQSQEAAPFNLGYENYAKLLFKLNEKEKLIHFLKEKALPTFPTNPVLNSIWLKVK